MLKIMEDAKSVQSEDQEPGKEFSRAEWWGDEMKT